MARRGKLSDRRSRHDAAYQQAKASGFAARAIFKLEELDKRFRLLPPGRRVLDLGCWPGSWMQYATERVGEEGLVVGIDRVEVNIALPQWARAIVGDVEELDPSTLVGEYGAFDVVLSDMAPKTTGHRAVDQVRSEALTERALFYATTVLRPGGHFVAKVFQGAAFEGLLRRLRDAFQEGKAVKVGATRAGSTEQYLVGRGFRGAHAATRT